MHQNFYQRKSLVCDIVEPFRVIIDQQIKKAWNLGQIKTEDFTETKGQYILEYKNAKSYTKWLMASRWVIREKSLLEFPQYKFKSDDK